MKQMSETEMVDKIKTVITDICGGESSDIEMDTALVDDIGIDSLDIVEIALELEELFDIEIDVDSRDIDKLETFGELVEYVKRLVDDVV